jgi:probable HAF family extracellular repeat protein
MNYRILLHQTLLCLPALLLSAPPLLAQTKTVYIIKSVGTLGGDFSDARNLNDKGEVVGVARTAGGQDHAFVYVNGTMTDLGTLGGNNSIALAISRNGKVVGSAEKAGAAFKYATAFSRGGGANLDISPAGTLQGEATANNDRGSGEVAGFTTTGGFGVPSKVRAFHQPGFAPVTPVLMPLLGGTENRAFGINDSGDIVGSSLLAGDGSRKAFLFTGGNMVNIGDMGGTNAEARDINNSGRIVGWSDTAGGQRAFLRFNGTFFNLGSLGGNSIAHAINDANEIVGTSKNGAGADLAFLYKNGTMTDLNTLLPDNSGWTLHFANGINENGQIVGYGTFNGKGRGFLMEPDRKGPVVKPAVTRLSTSSSSAIIKGTATDEGNIRIVQFRVGSGPFQKAKGTKKWRFKAPLEPGRNVIQVRARDEAGNTSRTRRVVVTRS